MIVLAIIAAFGAVTWPALMRPWAKSRVQEGAHEFGQALLKARLDAIESGQPRQVRWLAGGRSYEVVAVDPADRWPLTGASLGASSAVDRQQVSSDGKLTADTVSRRPTPQQLPEGVVFADEWRPRRLAALDETQRQADELRERGNATLQPRIESPPAGTTPGGMPPSAPGSNALVQWASPIWFYPDGRSSTNHWTLISDDGYQIEVSLRGFTGSYRVSPVRLVDPVNGEVGSQVNPAARQPDDPRSLQTDPFAESPS